MVEFLLPKQAVVGSNPITRSIFVSVARFLLLALKLASLPSLVLRLTYDVLPVISMAFRFFLYSPGINRYWNILLLVNKGTKWNVKN